MKDYSGMNIFQLMKVPTKELRELTMEEFAKEIRTKKVNIHPFTNKNDSYTRGDIYIIARNATIFVENKDGENRLSIFEWDSRLLIDISENIIFGIYSYGNGKIYRIAFEGNNPDLLICFWERDDKKQIIQDDIRDLVRKYEKQKRYEPNNSEMLDDIIDKLKKIIDEL